MISDDFAKGWAFFSNNASETLGAELSATWADDIYSQYQVIEERITEVCKQRAAQNPSIAQGFLAEMWHTETFNLNALIRGSGSVAEMLEETYLGSSDIRITNDKLGLLFDFSSKYYKTGAASAHEQSISLYEKFCRYAAKHNIDKTDDHAFQAYLAQNGLDTRIAKDIGLYNGQMRLVPQEQIKDAIAKLNRDIAKAQASGNNATVQRLTEARSALCGVIGDGKGTESIPLSRDDAEKIIHLCKNGEFDLAKFIDLKSLISFDDIMRDAVKSGANAALLSVVLRLAPEVIKSVQYLLHTGQLDIDQLKKLGMSAVTASSRGFITGTISAALTSSSKLGILGAFAKNISPESIGALTALTYQVCTIAFNHTIGKCNVGEMKDEILRAIFTTGCSVALGSLAALVNPMAYLLGSLIGSLAGAFVYGTIYQSYISFCVDTGFTLFGLVEQDYTITSELAEIMGVDYVELDTVSLDDVSLDEVQLDTVELDEIQLDHLGIYWVKRGVIGINKIGYITELV